MTTPNAPVYYALAQAKFSPVEAMSKYVGDIQDHLRRMGYTLFEEQQVAQLQLTVAAAGQSSQDPKVTHTTIWLITKTDRTAGFVLNSSSIGFHTTHYKRSADFLPELLAGLKVIHEVVALDHVARLGLRYLDCVRPEPGEQLESYLVGGLHGVKFGREPKYALSESVSETDVGPLVPKGQLLSRVIQVNSPLSFPPDLTPSGLVLMDRFQVKEGSWHAMLDTDHSSEGPMPLNFKELHEQLTSLHTIIKAVFKQTTTDYARNKWHLE